MKKILMVMVCVMVLIGCSETEEEPTSIVPVVPQVETLESEPEQQPIISKEKVKETEVIPFEETSMNDETIEKGKTVVNQEGVEGELTKTYEITTVDGVQTNRELVGESITKASIAKVILVGTKEPEVAVTVKEEPKKSTPSQTTKPASTTKPAETTKPTTENKNHYQIYLLK